MSSDFAFWKAGEGDPGDIYDGLADGITDALVPHALTLPVRMLGRLDGIFALARRCGLRGYSGVADEAF
jgi:hypothetical protein